MPPRIKQSFIGSNTISFNISYGACEFISFPGFTLSSKYMDDVYFQFGEYGIYLNRHIIRAFNEARENLIPLLSPNLQYLAIRDI